MRVRQIDNVLDLFEIYARERSPLTLTALSQALGIPKSSTFNIIETLVSRGFLYETKPRGGYYPTQRLLALARSTRDGDPLTARLHYQLQALAAATGETSASVATAASSTARALERRSMSVLLVHRKSSGGREAMSRRHPLARYPRR